MSKIVIYDTTLRDGAQAEGISFTINDKIKIAEKLNEIGVHYIEGGWPLSNPKDNEFYKHFVKNELKTATVATFGSTRKAKTPPQEDPNLLALLSTKAKTVTIFGKSWDAHVTTVLKTSLEENLRMIADSVGFLKKKKKEVFFDAEHFFDGYKNNQEYALKAILTAQEAGADCLVLCDTNGGTLTSEIKQIIGEIKEHITTNLGIHVHNDLGLAVANSVAAVEAGCTQVQGTFNGIGERCGNADLVTIIGILHTKLKLKSLPSASIAKLKDTAYFISDVSNFVLQDNKPFVGHSAFAHKGGAHIDAMIKNSLAYEHIDPKIVGNKRRLITSELAGKMPIVMKAKEMDIELDKKSPQAKELLKLVVTKENQGYQYEAADASFELLMKRSLKKYKPFFKLEGFKVSTEKRFDGRIFAEASIRLEVDGKEKFSASEGNGPVDALDQALRKALVKFYPNLDEMYLTDYKVRVLASKDGAAAKVRVLIESQDNHESWATVGVHENIIEASWEALIDSIEYKLIKDQKK